MLTSGNFEITNVCVYAALAVVAPARFCSPRAPRLAAVVEVADGVATELGRRATLLGARPASLHVGLPPSVGAGSTTLVGSTIACWRLVGCLRRRAPLVGHVPPPLAQLAVGEWWLPSVGPAGRLSQHLVHKLLRDPAQ